MSNPDFIELERDKVYAAVSLLTGLSRDDLDDLGGFGDPEPPPGFHAKMAAIVDLRKRALRLLDQAVALAQSIDPMVDPIDTRLARRLDAARVDLLTAKDFL